MSTIDAPGNRQETNTGSGAPRKERAGLLSNVRIGGRIGLRTGRRGRHAKHRNF